MRTTSGRWVHAYIVKSIFMYICFVCVVFPMISRGLAKHCTRTFRLEVATTICMAAFSDSLQIIIVHKILPRASLVNSLIVLKHDTATACTHTTHFALSPLCSRRLVHFMLNTLKENSYSCTIFLERASLWIMPLAFYTTNNCYSRTQDVMTLDQGASPGDLRIWTLSSTISSIT